MFSQETRTLPFKLRTFCGLCGKNYGTKTWHCVDHVWACHERGITGHLHSSVSSEALFSYVSPEINI